MSEPEQREGVPFLGVSLTDAAPGVLADLWSIIEDLQYVAPACRRIMASPPDPPEGSADELLQRALWESAVIAYGRCFASGKGHLRPGAARTRSPRTSSTPQTRTSDGCTVRSSRS